MDNSTPNIEMMIGTDSKKHCCAPLIESLHSITWVQRENPSAKVFMTIGIHVDQHRNYSERELCSSSFSEKNDDKNGRRGKSCPSSIDEKNRQENNGNNNIKMYETTYPISHGYHKLHRSVYQSRLYKTTLINIALIKKNVLVHVSYNEETIKG
jgi:hypothetical protein